MILCWVFFAVPISAHECERLVLLSPSVSDLVITAGLGEQIVGATRYCLLPEEQKVADIGGYFDLNIEAVVQREPSLVLYQSVASGDREIRALQQRGIESAGIPMTTLSEILAAPAVLAELCSLPQKNQLADYHNKLQALIDEVSEEGEPPTILLFYGIGGDYQQIFPTMVAGVSFHSELVEVLGFRNAYRGRLNAPTLSAEAITHLKPDLLILLEGGATHFNERNRLIVEEIEGPKYIRQGLKRGAKIYRIEGYSTQIPTTRALYYLGKELIDIKRAWRSQQNS